MNSVWLAAAAPLAAMVAIRCPAQAQAFGGSAFVQGPAQVQRFAAPPSFGDGFDRHRHRGGNGEWRGGGVESVVYLGPDGLSTYDDRAWAPESGNGWWHDRPDRAFPRWVQHNQNCTPDRMWWSGSGWHC